MKTCCSLFIVLLFSISQIQAQFVTIPDDNFVTWLEVYYPDCMDGNQMDTTCNGIITATIVDCTNQGISSIEGIQYFDELMLLFCDQNELTEIPYLPQESVINLRCSSNNITTINNLPPNLWSLNIGTNTDLSEIPELPESLEFYYGGSCPNLPPPAFPEGLKYCDFQSCGLTEVPELPENLESLIIPNNSLGEIVSVPPNLIELFIYSCDLEELPPLPNTLENLSCGWNNISDLGELPESITSLNITNLPLLTTINQLPDSMWYFNADNCNLSNIAYFPTYCETMQLDNNDLSSIPDLPINIGNLKLKNNNLSEISELPNSLYIIDLENNNFYCTPIFPNDISSVNLLGNPFTCLSNYVYSMTVWSFLDTVPLCDFDDPENNPYACQNAHGIEGHTFNDFNDDCANTEVDSGLANATVRIYDDSSTLLATTSTSGNGRYFFQTEIGDYTIEVDTVNKPFMSICPNPGVDSLVLISESDSLINDVDFPFVCKPGYDVGTQSVFTNGWVFPGQSHDLKIRAGDISGFYNLNCADGVSGSVVVEISGPIDDLETVGGSFTPSIDGLTLTYDIDDFANVNMFSDFNMLLTVETTAQDGDAICINVTVSPDDFDQNPNNNNYEYCYTVVNSYDPNNKLVYPESVLPNYDDWLTYTINFQNTGSAPAFNIRLEDTLSDLLDLSTFEVIGYSHDNNFTLAGNNLIIYYPNIMLLDSTTNEEASKGNFQFRIKPQSGLPNGTELENTAFIYFDYNEPVITNTAVTVFEIITGVDQLLNPDYLSLYPNPNDGDFKLEYPTSIDFIEVKVIDILGKEIPFEYSKNNGLMSFSLDEHYHGIFLLNLQSTYGSTQMKFHVQ